MRRCDEAASIDPQSQRRTAVRSVWRCSAVDGGWGDAARKERKGKGGHTWEALTPTVQLATVLFAITGLTACKDGHRDKDKHMGMFFDYMAYKLDFTPEQELILDRIQTQVKTIKAECNQIVSSKIKTMYWLFQKFG